MVLSNWGERDKRYEKHKYKNQRKDSKSRQGDQRPQLRVYLRRAESLYRMGAAPVYARNGDVEPVDQINLSEARQPG